METKLKTESTAELSSSRYARAAPFSGPTDDARREVPDELGPVNQSELGPERHSGRAGDEIREFGV